MIAAFLIPSLYYPQTLAEEVSKGQWGPTWADTVTILAAGWGIFMGSWMNYQMGLIAAPALTHDGAGSAAPIWYHLAVVAGSDLQSHPDCRGIVHAGDSADRGEDDGASGRLLVLRKGSAWSQGEKFGEIWVAREVFHVCRYWNVRYEVPVGLKMKTQKISLIQSINQTVPWTVLNQSIKQSIEQSPELCSIDHLSINQSSTVMELVRNDASTVKFSAKFAG